jgi:hypothetical protein
MEGGPGPLPGGASEPLTLWAIPRGLSAWKRGRLRRNLLIERLHRQGFSIALIADVFGQSRTNVRLVLQKAPRRGDPAESDLAERTPSVTGALATGSNRTQRRYARRNLIIRLLHSQGVSQRYLAEVFALARSRVAEILQETPGEGEPGPQGGEAAGFTASVETQRIRRGRLWRRPPGHTRGH